MIWELDSRGRMKKITGEEPCLFVRLFYFGPLTHLFPVTARKEDKMNKTTGDGKTLGQRIKELRKNKGWTQEEMAEIMCVNKPLISAYENDRVDISGSVLLELSRILDTTPNHLLGVEKQEDEVARLFSRITDTALREALLLQMRALADR